MRVVSLACSNTEIVCALGCAHLLVGVDDHSDYPPEVVRRLPRVGPDLQIRIPEVAALQPDLVLASLTVPGHERVVAALERAGLPFVAPAPTSLAEVYRDIRLIAARLGVPESGEALVRRMEAAFEALGPPPPGSPRLLIQWWPKPVIVPGRESWVQDLLRLAGGINPAGDRPAPSVVLRDEEIPALAPDAVVIAWCGVRPEKYRPAVVVRHPTLGATAAVRAGRVFCIPEAYLGRPGPRLVEGARALRRVVQAVAGEDQG